MVASRDGSRDIILRPHPSADQSGDNTCNFKEFSQDIPSHRLADIPPTLETVKEREVGSLQSVTMKPLDFPC